jgi:hypothetical protein
MPYESLAPVQATASLPYEALQSVQATAELPYEALGVGTRRTRGLRTSRERLKHTAERL